jgi:CRISPR-associated protein Cas5 subtype I-B
MEALQLNIKGNWAHFRRAETNNNPLSHDFITKTALIGMIGAVIGKERKEMKKLFPMLSEDIRYGVQIKNIIKKQSYGFTYRRVEDVHKQAPKHIEILLNPDYLVTIGLENDRSKSLFDSFKSAIKSSSAVYTPVLGLHNCPAELLFESEGELRKIDQGEFETKGFISSKHKIGRFNRLGFDRVPTFQNDDFWNIPEKYVPVVYPSANESIETEGEYYIYNNSSNWVLI